MVGSYWKRVAKRAWRRSLELVRLESWERVVVFLIGLLIPAAAVWYFVVGDTASATVRALATLGGAAIGAALIFGWSLLKLPAVMEAEAEAERARLAAQFQTEERRRLQRESLGSLLSSANNLAQAYCSHQPIDPIIVAVNEWKERAVELSEIHLDGAHQALLWSDTGIVCGEPALAEERMGRWRWVTYRAIRLQQIIQSL